MKKNSTRNVNSLLLLFFVFATLGFLMQLSITLNSIAIEQSNIHDVDISLIWIVIETDKSYSKHFNMLGVLSLITIIVNIIGLLLKIDWKRF